MNSSTRGGHPGAWTFLLVMCVPAAGPAADQEEPLWRGFSQLFVVVGR